MVARSVYAPLDGNPRWIRLCADLGHRVGRRLDGMGAQEAKGSDCDGNGGEVFLHQAGDHIGLRKLSRLLHVARMESTQMRERSHAGMKRRQGRGGARSSV